MTRNYFISRVLVTGALAGLAPAAVAAGYTHLTLPTKREVYILWATRGVDNTYVLRDRVLYLHHTNYLLSQTR